VIAFIVGVSVGSPSITSIDERDAHSTKTTPFSGLYSDIPQLNQVYASCLSHAQAEIAWKVFGSSFAMNLIGYEYNNGTHTIDNNTCKFTPNTQIKECESGRPSYSYRDDTYFYYKSTCEWIPNSYLERILN